METEGREIWGMRGKNRQQIARTSNEIYQRTQKRKATAKEKGLLNELKKLMGGLDLKQGC